jgi:hypothetical protein
MSIYIETDKSGLTLVLVCEQENDNGVICGTENRAGAEYGDNETSSPNTLYAGDIVCEKCGTKYHSVEKSFH